jgi:hypothetical protein
MSAGTAASPNSNSWRELYKAALFETDKNRASECIANAQCALALRSRELFHVGSELVQERQAVDAAIYALYIFRRTTVCGSNERNP